VTDSQGDHSYILSLYFYRTRVRDQVRVVFLFFPAYKGRAKVYIPKKIFPTGESLYRRGMLGLKGA